MSNPTSNYHLDPSSIQSPDSPIHSDHQSHHPPTTIPITPEIGVVEEMVKEGGFCWILQNIEEEGVAEQKLGGGAHQDQSGWSKTTGVMDL
ncbi:hypothetical protein PPACK8108_LOCUS11862 [Phakopsora pachyrhizi]|uniref:Uncharacterized protein n=1 Tax=Phakopsora pachyrhizi TaxID=170000 RepID=A0AAV0B0X9_PHAPC|nr:hypothetical protein PPACK8108_LOCUS11862 [Phakopsora pachyrhizi]